MLGWWARDAYVTTATAHREIPSVFSRKHIHKDKSSSYSLLSLMRGQDFWCATPENRDVLKWVRRHCEAAGDGGLLSSGFFRALVYVCVYGRYVCDVVRLCKEKKNPKSKNKAHRVMLIIIIIITVALSHLTYCQSFLTRTSPPNIKLIRAHAKPHICVQTVVFIIRITYRQNFTCEPIPFSELMCITGLYTHI